MLVAVGKHDTNLNVLKRCMDTYDNSAVPNRAKMEIQTKMQQTAPAKGLRFVHIEYKVTI